MATKQPEIRHSGGPNDNPDAAQLERAMKTEMMEAFNQMQRYRGEGHNKSLYNNYHDRYVRLATQLRDHMDTHGEQGVNLATRLVGHINGAARLIESGVQEAPGMDYVREAREVAD